MTKGDRQWTRDNQSELLQRYNRWLRTIGLMLVIGLAVVVIVGMFEWQQPERTGGTESRPFYDSRTQPAPNFTRWLSHSIGKMD